MGLATSKLMAISVGVTATVLVLVGCASVEQPPGMAQQPPVVAQQPQAAAAKPAATPGVADATPSLAREAPPRPETLAYTAPTGEPAPGLERQLSLPPARVFDQTQQALRTVGLRIGLLDERAGILVATYSGDPAQFVNCGTITARPDQGQARQLDAATSEMKFNRAIDGRGRTVDRDLILNARLVIQLRPDGNGTRLRDQATYVVSKRTKAGDGPAQVETIAFESGGRGTFAKGTVCQPTGALERLVLTPPAAA